MNQLKSKPTKHIPEWQSQKMKMMIAERWLDIWEEVKTRQIETRRNLFRLYDQQCQK